MIRVYDLDAAARLRGDIGTLSLALVADVAEADFPAAAAEVRRRLAAEVPPDKARDIAAATWVMMGLKFGDENETARSFMALFQDLLEKSTTYQAPVAKGEARGEARGEANMSFLMAEPRLGSPPVEVADRIRAAIAAGKRDAVAARVSTAAAWDEVVIP